MDDLVGEIMSDVTARDAIVSVLERAEAPEFLRAIIFGERYIPLRQALFMFPDSDEAVKIMNAALEELELLVCEQKTQ